MTARRIDMHGRRGVVPGGAVYVGRFTPAARTHGPALAHSPFANPFGVGRYGRERTIEMYRERLASRPDLVERARQELTGKVLACWCALDEPCHADVLLEVIARQGDGDRSHGDARSGDPAGR
jgi:Domain of unknown function (DUF4326)